MMFEITRLNCTCLLWSRGLHSVWCSQLSGSILYNPPFDHGRVNPPAILISSTITHLQEYATPSPTKQSWMKILISIVHCKMCRLYRIFYLDFLIWINDLTLLIPFGILSILTSIVSVSKLTNTCTCMFHFAWFCTIVEIGLVHYQLISLSVLFLSYSLKRWGKEV